MTGPRMTRRKRANGVESRQRILDAAVQIAGERGYEGTSMAAVSAKCGLPASSIYWHFTDKDDLIAAVRALTAYAVAGADGLFIQREVNGDDVDLVELFELHACLVYTAAMRSAVRSGAGQRTAANSGKPACWFSLSSAHTVLP